MIKDKDFKLTRMRFIHKNDDIMEDHMISSMKWLFVYTIVFNIIKPESTKLLATAIGVPVILLVYYIFYLIFRGKIVAISFYFTDLTNKENIYDDLIKEFEVVEKTNKPNVFKIKNDIILKDNGIIELCTKEDNRNE